MMVMGRVVTGVLVLIALTGCGRRHDSGASSGDYGYIDPNLEAVQLDVSPNPAAKFATVTIDASGSFGNITGFEFDFGDGTPHVSQTSPIATHAYDVVNYADTHYMIHVRGWLDASASVEASKDLLVKDLPPALTTLDSGADKKAVIGEWVYANGKNFLGLPAITVDGVPATNVVALDVEHLKFRVPPTSRAGDRAVVLTWPGYAPVTDTLTVKRFAVATSSRFDRVYVMDVSATEAITDTGIRLDVADAATVKLSPDGSTAYVTNGRFNFLSTGTVTMIDMTADNQPVIANTFSVGSGPLYDIEPAAKSPLLVAGDAFGIYLFDVSDPLVPVQRGYVSALFSGDPLNDVAAADIAVSPDGTKIAVLNALSAQARVFTQSNFAVANALTPVRINVGPKTQKAAISEDGNTLYVLGGGGEGAVPMDLSDPRAANVTAADISAVGNSIAPLMAGPYRLSDINANVVVAPIPMDLAISRSNPHRVYVTTLDQGFTTLFNKLSAFVNNLSWNALADLITFLNGGGLNFGHTNPITGADSSPVLGLAFQTNFTAPTAADLLYNDRRMLQSSFHLTWDSNNSWFVFQTGATALDTTSHAGSFMVFETESLDFNAAFALLTPPFSFGDVAFQP